MSAISYRSFDATFTSGATLTSEIDLGGSFNKLYIAVPASVTYTVYPQTTDTLSGTYGRVFYPATDGDALPGAISIDTSCTAGAAAFIPIDYFGRFVKLEAGTAVTNGASFKIIGVY